MSGRTSRLSLSLNTLKLCFLQKQSFVCGKKNSNNNMKKTFGSDSVFTRACHLLQSRLLRLCRNQTEGHIRTFCASAVPAPQEDRLASSPVRLLDWVSFTFCHHSLP
jgi:hypothetical protein